jgi:hypothetical protein
MTQKNYYSSSACTAQHVECSTSSLFVESENREESSTDRQRYRKAYPWLDITFVCLTLSGSSDISFNYQNVCSSSSIIHPTLYDADNEDRKNVATVQNFLMDMINKTEDLDGRIVEMVDEHFWDLI